MENSLCKCSFATHWYPFQVVLFSLLPLNRFWLETFESGDSESNSRILRAGSSSKAVAIRPSCFSTSSCILVLTAQNVVVKMRACVPRCRKCPCPSSTATVFGAKPPTVQMVPWLTCLVVIRFCGTAPKTGPTLVTVSNSPIVGYHVSHEPGFRGLPSARGRGRRSGVADLLTRTVNGSSEALWFRNILSEGVRSCGCFVVRYFSAGEDVGSRFGTYRSDRCVCGRGRRVVEERAGEEFVHRNVEKLTVSFSSTIRPGAEQERARRRALGHGVSRMFSSYDTSEPSSDPDPSNTGR